MNPEYLELMPDERDLYVDACFKHFQANENKYLLPPPADLPISENMVLSTVDQERWNLNTIFTRQFEAVLLPSLTSSLIHLGASEERITDSLGGVSSFLNRDRKPGQPLVTFKADTYGLAVTNRIRYRDYKLKRDFYFKIGTATKNILLALFWVEDHCTHEDCTRRQEYDQMCMFHLLEELPHA